MADTVAKIPKRRATKFPPTTKQAATVDRCSLKRATEVVSEFVTESPTSIFDRRPHSPENL